MQDFRERATRALITAAYAIPLTSRFAPDLLGYVPTYTSYLKKKSRQQGVPRAGRGRGRGRGERETSGGGVCTPEAEDSNSGPRGIIREEINRETPERIGLSGEMTGRGERVVPNLRRQRPRGRGTSSPFVTPGAGSLRAASISPEGPPEKRTRHEEGDSSRGKEKDTILIEEEEERGGETGGEEADAETRVPSREVPWAPEFRHYVERLIHHADSASTNIGTAFGVLRSSILPRDARAVKGSTKDLTGEIA